MGKYDLHIEQYVLTFEVKNVCPLGENSKF